MRSGALSSLGVLTLGVTFAAGCKDEATRACQAELVQAQEVVKSQGGSRSGVEQSIAAVDRALALCRTAKRDSEVEQLTNARRELASHLDVLKERAGKQKRTKPTAAEVEELIKHGDASCPRGMAYKAEGSDKQVRCIGPQPIRMSFAKARDYYKSLGFRVTPSESPPGLRAEFGAELLVFGFATVNDPAPPRCLTYYPPPQMPWQEAVARLTGAQLNRIKQGAPVPLPDGEVPLRVDESQEKLVIYLGSGCG
jgi:hypothetical protein